MDQPELGSVQYYVAMMRYADSASAPHFALGIIDSISEGSSPNRLVFIRNVLTATKIAMEMTP